ncbi:peroxisomal membrane protein 11A [Agrilus planipennis]|uniref:Peroxisomal membrane protein 11A n=1 Tax=Agrilus planipennis TaxID=224129 RepID=A0A1W4WQV6_AGRPL|nr:peroxisomal membrane protein 11A [Agrilus planipennis]XP_018322857.1 peroxisomal membrane protein 11A [Agrilus planipennis]
MDTLIQLNKQTAGRDKLARLCQYLSRFLWYNLQNKQKFLNNNAINNLKSLEYQLSTFRKLLRWGRCLDVVYSTLPILNYPLDSRRFVDVLTKLSQAFYFLTDHILWLGRADLCQVDTHKWNQISNRYWLYTITLNLVKNFIEINNLFKLHSCQSLIYQIFLGTFSRNSFKNDVSWCNAQTLVLIQRHKALIADLIKNLCDLFIPLTTLGYYNLSPGFVGLLGVISSIAGLFILIDSTVKFIP